MLICKIFLTFCVIGVSFLSLRSVWHPIRIITKEEACLLSPIETAENASGGDRFRYFRGKYYIKRPGNQDFVEFKDIGKLPVLLGDWIPIPS